jgi:hypothetical protein
MSKLSSRIAALGLMSALALGTIASVPAYAKGGNADVRVAGKCSIASSSKLKLQHDNGRIETEFEVDSNRVGQAWTVAIGDNGTLVFLGSRTTTAPSGSFSIARRIPNKPGVDNVVAIAQNPSTGERCVARASI